MTFLDPSDQRAADVIRAWARTINTDVAAAVSELAKNVDPYEVLAVARAAAAGTTDAPPTPKVPTEDEKALIVDLHQAGFPLRAIGAIVGRDKDTAARYVNLWRKREAKAAEGKAPERRADLTAKHYLAWQKAVAAQDRAARIKDHKAAQGWASEARACLAEIAKLTGAAAPVRTELTGKDGGPLATATVDVTVLTDAELKALAGTS